LVILSSYQFNIGNAEEIFVKDKNLKVELVVEGLNSPTSMAFLGPNDILVLEKQGKVQRISGNDIQADPALDVTNSVNNSYERGLIGIAIRSDEQIEEDAEDDYTDMRSIYLYYTENVTDKEDSIDDCFPNECQTIGNLENRLYKYQFEGGKLVNPTLIISMPLNDTSDFIHVGGIITFGPDNNIYLSVGDGKTCGYYEECRMIVEGGPLDSQTANIKDGVNASGKGGILHFGDVGGKVVYPKGILGENYPLNLYYAYGIRNSFGIDFDPISGILWDTENGPAFGDEINLVEPGFNSGWTVFQGIWPITNVSLLANDPPPGIAKGYFISNENLGSDNNLIYDFNGKGKYSQPEFTWNHTVGVTAIKFFNSEEYGQDYENDLFVGSFNGGFIYHFDLTEDRKELLLKGVLQDKVANNGKELSQVALARGFGGITDLEVGPDGNLYIVSVTEGKIWRLVASDKNNLESN
jgi:glucose/arabinose dehydrogenase